jgi:hypothetical protein
MKAPAAWVKDCVDVLNELFLWLFVAELVMKLVALRSKFWWYRERVQGWNILDSIIVGFGLLDRFVTLNFGLDPMFLRLLRLVKMARFAKMFKMAGSLHSMNLILKSVAASRSALFWSMLLLFMIQMVVGMCVGQLVQAFIVDETNDASARKEVFRYYGTFTKCQFTMFEITHVNYAAAARVLTDHISEWWAWFFVIYRCSVAFAFLQVIRAVFIQRTLKVAERDRDLMIHNKKLEVKELHAKLSEMFDLLNIHHTESINRDAFLSAFKEESTKIWMSALDIDASDPEGLFELLDLDGSGEISKDEFIFGAAKLRGIGSQRDIFSLQNLGERIEAKVDMLLPAILRGKCFPDQVVEVEMPEDDGVGECALPMTLRAGHRHARKRAMS